MEQLAPLNINYESRHVFSPGGLICVPQKALNHLAQEIRVVTQPDCLTLPRGGDNWVKRVASFFFDLPRYKRIVGERGENNMDFSFLIKPLKRAVSAFCSG